MDGASLEQDRKRTREASTLGASCEADAADILAELSSKFSDEVALRVDCEGSLGELWSAIGRKGV